jgi:tetratricopeptide (TPR) repeat protein
LRGQAHSTLQMTASSGPIVGRQAELRAIGTLLERARSGRGQVASLTGEPGVGKSRLAVEVIRLARRLGLAVHTGACRADGGATAYLVWQPIWRTLLEVDPSLSAAEQQTRLARRVAEYDGGSSRRAPLLSPVLNLPLPDSDLTASLDPLARAELLRSLLLDQFRAVATATPLLVVLEDCHWIDPASQLLLEFLARNVADQTVLIVVTSRPADTAATAFVPLAQLGHFAEIPIRQLPMEDAERLVTQRIGSLRRSANDVPLGVVRRIVASAGGNPLHLEELVRFLLEGATDPQAPRGPADPGVPDDLSRLVLARTDQLSDGEKVTIEVASVLGPRFQASWIWGSHASAGSPEQVLRYLDHLTELEFVRQVSPGPEPEYEFKHAITQEAVYESLSPGLRETLHGSVARFIERTYPDRLSQFVDLLAHHYGRTPDLTKQREWFRAAADAAKDTFATEAAIGYHERLLALLPPEQTGGLLIELGDLLLLAARWVDAEAVYDRALRVADSIADRTIHAEACRGLGSVLPYIQAQDRVLQQAADQLRRAVMEFDQLQDGRGLVKTLERLAWTSWELGDYPGALAASERHLDIATEAEDLVGVSTALENMGLVRWHTGEHAEALRLLQRALDTATMAGYRPGVIHAANDLAGVRSERGDHVRAIRDFWQALVVAQEIGDRRNVTLVIGNIGESHRRQGEYGRALRCFAHAFRIAVEIADRTGMAALAGNLATTVAAQGREPEAEQLLARAVKLAESLDAQFWICESLYQQALLLTTAGRLHEAEQAIQRVLDITSKHQQGRVELQAGLLSVRLLVALGRMERSAAMWQLRELRNNWVDPPEQAAILDALWQLDPSQEQWRRDAARLYRTLYDQAPTVEYREAYERLTGASLPAAPSLPPVPDSVSREPLDLSEVLEQLDQAIRQTRPQVARAG